MDFKSYILIGKVLAVALLLGVIGIQNHQIHYYHTAFDKEHQSFLTEHGLVVGMTTRQNKQTAATENVVTKVVQGPSKVKTILQEVTNTPVSVDCKTPDFPQEVKDAY